MEDDASRAQRRAATLAGHFQLAEQDAGIVRTGTGATARLKVAVIGAGGGIGQPLSLLMKLSPYISTLHLYDVVSTAGVAADVSHINTPAKVVAFSGQAQLAGALTGMDLVVIPAGVPRKPGMTRDDLFNINAGIVKTIVENLVSTRLNQQSPTSLSQGIALNCPDAWINIISNPVNSTVPIAAEVLKKHGKFNPNRLFGVTHLDVMRARAFVAGAMGIPPEGVDVPVIGGHAGDTILPLLSQVHPPFAFTEAETAALTTRIQNAGTEVVEAKAGAGSATLSMAAAAAEFAELCMRAKLGEPNVVACAYVASSLTDHPFFASRLVLGRSGAEQSLPLGPMSAFERACLEKMKAELKGSIEKGVQFANK